jgi:inorganic triphosphatase YgiF
MTGRALYDVGAPDELAHWLAQHPHIVMLAGSSQLDSYLDTGTGVLLQQGQLLRIRRRDSTTDAMLRDLATDTTIVEDARDGCLPEGGTIDSLVRALADREPIGTVRTVLTRRRRFVLLARRDWETEITLDASDVTAHGTMPARYWTCEVVALRSRPVDPVFLDRLERIGELRADAMEPWQRGLGRRSREPVAG